LQSKKEELAPKRMKKTDASSAGPAPLSWSIQEFIHVSSNVGP
jgi:hypothetical protein